MQYENYSVLMSVYYKEKPEYLKQSIESMLNQTVPTNDFVIVCDGPLTPELDAVIDSYKNALHVVRLEKNGGLGPALNEGLKHCRNELVARMDSDDISVPRRCEIQLEEYRKNPTLGILSASLLEFTETTDNVIGKRTLPVEDEQIRRYSKRRCPFNHPVVMFKKEAVQQAGGYNGRFHLFEDYYLWIRMIQTGVEARNISENLLYMRAPADMFQRRGGMKYAKDMLKFRGWMVKSGWSSWKDFTFSALPQAVVCVAPNWLREKVYAHLHDQSAK